jgi:hypothetical protein
MRTFAPASARPNQGPLANANLCGIAARRRLPGLCDGWEVQNTPLHHAYKTRVNTAFLLPAIRTKCRRIQPTNCELISEHVSSEGFNSKHQ